MAYMIIWSLSSILLAYFGVAVLHRWLIQHQSFVDMPNGRSSHTQPTPRGGGAVIVLITLISPLIYLGLHQISVELWLLAYILGGGLIAIVSWLDDRKSLPGPLRLAVHTVSAILVVSCIGYWRTVELPLIGTLDLAWFGLPITLLWIVGLTNAYNFMDGIDGLAGGQAVIAGLAWALISWMFDQPLIMLIALGLATASFGFLRHNWAPARIFMGDVGSTFLGYTFAVLPLMLTHLSVPTEYLSYLWVFGILLLWPFLFDSIFTFMRRLHNGEDVFQAHRTHLYQRLSGDIGYSHSTVTLTYNSLALLGVGLAFVWQFWWQSNGLTLILLLFSAGLGLWGYVTLQEMRRRSLGGLTMWLPEFRNRHLFALDWGILLVVPALALTIRLDTVRWLESFGPALIAFTGIALLLKLMIFYGFGVYQRYWPYASINDLTGILLAIVFSTLLLTLGYLNAQTYLLGYDLSLPRSLPLIDGMLTCLTIGGLRLAVRGLHHWYRLYSEIPQGQRVLVVGAGEAGILAAREMLANRELDMEPVAFVDDEADKVGMRIQGIPVLGISQQIPHLVQEYGIQQIVIAIPSASFKRQQEIADLCQQSGRATQTLAGMYELLGGYKTVSPMPTVDPNQLLQREPVTLDKARVSATLRDATVLVTGAGGSIGSELCRQIASCKPQSLILLGRGENSIFEIGLDLRLAYPELTTYAEIVDVRNATHVERVIKQYRPTIIFHAAAHKHVTFMQRNPAEALTNNVLGTKTVVQLAEKYDVERFVLISTDKAVNPSSIMGATKRLAELFVIATAQRSGKAYMAVRFGNVLGSRGSVLPIFQRQIASGGPVTVTHPHMERYFMTIPEAVALVLQASNQGCGGEIFVLDMGRQVPIQDLARNLIRMSGLQPERDIEIVYQGIQPGEKLKEELFLRGEDYTRTDHAKIFVAQGDETVQLDGLDQAVRALVRLAEQTNIDTPERQAHLLFTKMCDYINHDDTYQARTKELTRPNPPAAFDNPYPVPLR